jgi:hypothetical protein
MDMISHNDLYLICSFQDYQRSKNYILSDFFKFSINKKYNDIFFGRFRNNLIYVKGAKVMGANGITQATPTCFFITFMTIICEMFLEYFRNNILKPSKKSLNF